jgi:hypothetical protein
MGVQVYWVLFFITDNQEIQHGSPGVLGFIFHNGQPRIPMGVQVYWVLFFIKDNQNSIHDAPPLCNIPEEQEQKMSHIFTKERNPTKLI